MWIGKCNNRWTAVQLSNKSFVQLSNEVIYLLYVQFSLQLIVDCMHAGNDVRSKQLTLTRTVKNWSNKLSQDSPPARWQLLLFICVLILENFRIVQFITQKHDSGNYGFSRRVESGQTSYCLSNPLTSNPAGNEKINISDKQTLTWSRNWSQTKNVTHRDLISLLKK